MTRRSYVQIDGVLYERGTEPVSDAPFVMDDIAPFVDTTGTEITGRAKWRNHLKSIGSEEMGHSDVKAMQAQHQKRKDARNAKLARAADTVREVDVPYREGQELPRSSIAANVLNRLEGRPTPDRKTLIKIALEEARRGRR